MHLLEFIQKVKPNYVTDWYHELMIAMLEQAVAESTDVLCSGPPGCGKTELFGILFPSWLIAENPQTHIISLANSDGLSRMAAGNILRIVQSPAFQEIQPIELDKATEQTFLVHGNDGRPTLHAAGIKGQLSGHRANFLCYDDLTKSLSDAYSETIRERIWADFNSCAETRLLPTGRIFGIQTRWSLDDVHGRLIRRALDNPASRQFFYINLAARNNGAQSYVLDTSTREQQFIAPYESLATKEAQPYSFSAGMLRGKAADLGPTVFSALYMGQPVSQDNQMFPPEAWGQVDVINTDQYSMIVSAWDTASKDKATNDPSANVVIGRRNSGDWVVLDACEFRLTFDKLLPVVLERYRILRSNYRAPVTLCIEDASSGSQLLQIIKSQFPEVPWQAPTPAKSKIVRAEGVTPFTSARSVSLLKGEWNGQFITDLANFPASDRDHYVDAFVHGMKCFTSDGSDFRKPVWLLDADPRQQFRTLVQDLMAEQEYDQEFGHLDF
ncbi:MAG: terminase family protein [Candidatus Sulfotelmatobacter sp.]